MVFEPDHASPAKPLRVEELNPAFLRSRRIVPLDRPGEALTIACADGLSATDRAALEFATGSQLRIVEMSAQEIDGHLATLFDSPGLGGPLGTSIAKSPARLPGTAAGEAPVSDQTSLMGMLGARLQRSQPSYALLAPLLEANYSPKEAAKLLLARDLRGTPLDPALAALATKLAAGTSLGEAVQQQEQVPKSIRLALSASPTEAGQSAAFIELTSLESAAARQRAHLRLQRIESALLWLAAILAWFAVSNTAGFVMAALALAGSIWLRDTAADHPNNDLTRARVLRRLEITSALGVPPSSAIQTALAALETVSPTWGALPDTREGLADALRLPPLSRALLERGDLKDAAARAAAGLNAAGEAALARCYWLNTRVAVGLFMAAILLLGLQ